MAMAGLALGGAAQAWSEIAGVPDPPVPGPFPRAWLVWGNDALGGEVGNNPDDYRTSQFSLAGRFGDWLLAIDHSTLTNKGVEHPPAGRSDELTATVGWLLRPLAHLPGQPGPWLAIGAGARAHGDLGGESVQNRWHHLLAVPRIHNLAYDDDDGVEGVAYVSGDWLWMRDFPFPIPTLAFLEEGQIGFDLNASSLATTGGEVQTQVGLRLVLRGLDGAGWFGVRQLWNSGDAATPTADAVAAHEEGTSLTYGASAGGWFIDGSINLDSQDSTGSVGWMWGRGPGRAPHEEVQEMEAALAVFANSALGVQFRWRPAWLERTAFGPIASLLFDYRFGRVGGIDWQDSALVFRQPSIGIDLTTPRHRDRRWEVYPYLATSIGLREERIVDRGPAPRYPEEHSATGVFQIGAGLRLAWGDHPGGARTVRYGLGFGYDLAIPVTDAEAGSGADTALYLLPRQAIGGTLLAVVTW